MPISTPPKVAVPWATSGLKNTIPATANPVTGNAGYDAGFPAINMTAKEAGGIPPFGQDFNGIIFDMTRAIQYTQAGASFPYDSAFATAVGGYPLGALVQRTDGTGFWRNLVANNTTDPEAFGAGWSTEDAGITTVAMAAANVTLTALQASRQIITITGTLTANVQLILPTYQRQWLIVNNATGAFSVTCKTAGGSGVSIATGLRQSVYGDGTNISASSGAPVQQGVVGQFSNLKASATGLSALVSITADEVLLEAAAGVYLTVRAASLTLNTAGSGANGLDTGTIAASTWYYVYVISNGTTTAALCSLSPTAPTMPSGFTYKALVSVLRSDGTANKFPLSFVQGNDRWKYKLVAASNTVGYPQLTSGLQGTAPSTWATVSTASAAPPIASSIHIAASALAQNLANAWVAPNSAHVTTLNAANTAPLAFLQPVANAGGAALNGVLPLESANISVIASGGANQSTYCTGFGLNL